MKFVLVLQWPASSIEAYEAIIAVEDLLIEKLPGDCEVDGHDAGSGQVNIFIKTGDPRKTFGDVKRVLDKEDSFDGIRAAYRDQERSEYVLLWPPQLGEFQVS